MLKHLNKLQNTESCLHFAVQKRSLTRVDMHYESNKVAYVMGMTIASRSKSQHNVKQWMDDHR